MKTLLHLTFLLAITFSFNVLGQTRQVAQNETANKTAPKPKLSEAEKIDQASEKIKKSSDNISKNMNRAIDSLVEIRAGLRNFKKKSNDKIGENKNEPSECINGGDGNEDLTQCLKKEEICTTDKDCSALKKNLSENGPREVSPKRNLPERKIKAKPSGKSMIKQE